MNTILPIFIFQLFTLTYFRVFAKGDNTIGFSRNQYLVSIIPIIGIAYALFLLFRYILTEDKQP